MKPLSICTAVALTILSSYALAESGKILKGKEVNEAALIQALSPDEGSIRTRSLRIERDSPTTPRATAAASLLITFPTNSAALMPQAKHQLDIVGRALNNEKLATFKFAIEGHADPRGAADLNQRLSEERAESVREYLVEAHHVNAERLTALGKGDKDPINTKNPASPENRRVTIINQTAQ